ncbi:MAG: hypothetical protein RLZZ502_108, partial [Pseudomonadota bacterium]
MADLHTLNTQVQWLCFALAFVFAYLAQAGNFCTMGAIADVVNFADWTRARMVVTAMATAMLATSLLAAAGWVDVSKSIYLSNKLLWASHLLGGLLFGFGMVLASGCGSKTLLRIGGGSLKSLVAFLVMGLFAYMTLKGIFAVARVASLDQWFVQLTTTQDLPHVLNLPLLPVAGGIALLMFAFVLKDTAFRHNLPALATGLGLGLVIAAVWWLSGKFAYLAEHPETLDMAFVGSSNNRPESFSFTAPAALLLDYLMLFSDKSKVLNISIVSCLGMLAGAAAQAVISKSFRWEGFANTEDLANHLVGGALMGIGGVTALGCTIGQGLSGFSTLALGAVLTIIGLIVGAVLALKYQM